MTEITDLLGFEERTPQHKNAVELFPGSWSSKFPASAGIAGGESAHFDDVRVSWAASALDGLNGLSILELGPYEAYNTYQFQAAGVGSVVAIESSRINFLKCLVVKNIFGLSATFLHGDFQRYLATTKNRFDVCWASGVLYHMTKPIELLQGIRRVAEIAFIWTQYYDEENLRRTGNLAFFDASRDTTVEFAGRPIRLRHRNYMETAGLGFSGGGENFSYWMERADIMFVLNTLGYEHIQIGIDNPDHPPGPAMFFIARTTPK